MITANQKSEGNNKIGIWKYPGKKFDFEKDILLRETNLMGNTYFANYVVWQGEARERLLLKHPQTLEWLKNNQHIKMITYETHHRFLHETTFGSRVRLEVTSREIKRWSFVLIFRYFDALNNEKIGEGWQRACFMDLRTNKICEVPQLILDLVEPITEDLRPTHT